MRSHQNQAVMQENKPSRTHSYIMQIPVESDGTIKRAIRNAFGEDVDADGMYKRMREGAVCMPDTIGELILARVKYGSPGTLHILDYAVLVTNAGTRTNGDSIDLLVVDCDGFRVCLWNETGRRE